MITDRIAAEKITIPGLDNDEQDTLDGLVVELDRKARRNRLRKAYYDGKHAVERLGPVVPPQYYQLAIVLGWSAKAVDILARRCNLDGFVWPDGDLASLGIDEVVEDNFLGAESSAAVTSSLIHSVSFLVNTEGDGDGPKSLIHTKDALNATGEWNQRTRRLDNLLSITSRDEEGRPTGLALYLENLTIVAERRSGRWAIVDRSTHPWGVPAEPLVYRYRPGRPFGASRISRAVMSLHDQAIRTVIRMEGHADVFSFPELLLLGADESVFKNADGTTRAVWEVMLGRIKGIPDDDNAVNPRADVKQFAASSPAPHIEMLRQQAQLFSGETSIPLTSLGVSDMSNPTSADSYIASREDLIAEAEGATDDWSPAFRRSMMRALAIQNDLDEIPPEWRSIDTKWRSPIYLSRAAQADAGMKQLTAVPWLAETEVGLELLGLTEQQIERALADRRRANVRQILDRLPAVPDVTAQAPAQVDETATDGSIAR
ncbi:phage portal protein [Nocardia sp. CA-290969]|uniref:phage portal protein n=1 Tax=Nocardia sp. CA-290969 TaxID=3239986 RepID=UPI003D900B26